MKNAWKRWDFEGFGLQSLNLALSRRLKRRPTAYGLWLGFPLGLHALYLGERRRAAAYCAASLLLAVLAATVPWPYAAGLGGLMLIAALSDLATLEARLTRINKALRMASFLRPNATPPAGYRGRYVDTDTDLDDYLALKERERAGHPAKTEGPAAPTRGKTASFQEQEAALRAHIARKHHGAS